VLVTPVVRPALRDEAKRDVDSVLARQIVRSKEMVRFMTKFAFMKSIVYMKYFVFMN
jgi:hypothetical protein